MNVNFHRPNCLHLYAWGWLISYRLSRNNISDIVLGIESLLYQVFSEWTYNILYYPPRNICDYVNLRICVLLCVCS